MLFPPERKRKAECANFEPMSAANDTATLLHYEVIGDNPQAPWMVLIHGAGGSIKTWKFQIEAFAPHYRLLLLDLRDHGYSKDILPEFPVYDFDIVAEDILRCRRFRGRM